MTSEDTKIRLRGTWEALAPVCANCWRVRPHLPRHSCMRFLHVLRPARPVWFVVCVVDALKRSSKRVAIARVVVPLATLLSPVANYSVQKSIATTNAAKIIRACDSYREANGSYPDRLGQLVPRYLNSIPRAKYCYMLGEFWYVRSPETSILWWYEVPPFGKMMYNFERGTWRYVD